MEFWKPANVKAEQSTGIRFYSYKVRKLVKLLEILSALILVLWSSTRLPVAVKLLAESAKQLCALLLSTPSVFLIGNAIVVALVGSFQSSPGPNPDPYEEFVERSRRMTQTQSHEVELEKQSEEEDSSSAAAAATVPESVDVSEVSKVKRYRRTQSESVVLVRPDVRKELRRSRTGDVGMEGKLAWEKRSEVVDDLSGDEFRRRVEAFIAKQQRFLRDENTAPVLLSH
uniref:DUF4408 domain-containing protein n=1 Tax=Kalanchoe fedtschenkoi TaxID=63787 RepID=A0A7N0V2I7_KALFE